MEELGQWEQLFFSLVTKGLIEGSDLTSIIDPETCPPENVSFNNFLRRMQGKEAPYSSEYDSEGSEDEPCTSDDSSAGWDWANDSIVLELGNKWKQLFSKLISEERIRVEDIILDPKCCPPERERLNNFLRSKYEEMHQSCS